MTRSKNKGKSSSSHKPQNTSVRDSLERERDGDLAPTDPVPATTSLVAEYQDILQNLAGADDSGGPDRHSRRSSGPSSPRALTQPTIPAPTPTPPPSVTMDTSSGLKIRIKPPTAPPPPPPPPPPSTSSVTVPPPELLFPEFPPLGDSAPGAFQRFVSSLDKGTFSRGELEALLKAVREMRDAARGRLIWFARELQKLHTWQTACATHSSSAVVGTGDTPSSSPKRRHLAEDEEDDSVIPRSRRKRNFRVDDDEYVGEEVEPSESEVDVDGAASEGSGSDMGKRRHLNRLHKASERKERRAKAHEPPPQEVTQDKKQEKKATAPQDVNSDEEVASENEIAARPLTNLHQTPNTFWSSLEPYFADVAGEDLKYLQPVALQSDDPILVIPPLGRHYADLWAEEDSVDGLAASSPLASQQVSPPDEDELGVEVDEAFDGASFTQRILAALLEEHVVDRSTMDRILSEESLTEPNVENSDDKRIEPTVPAAVSEAEAREAGTDPRIAALTLEQRIRLELKALGLLEDDELDLEDDRWREDDEVCTELRSQQDKLKRLITINNTKRAKLFTTVFHLLDGLESERRLKHEENEILQTYTKKMRRDKQRKKKHRSSGLPKLGAIASVVGQKFGAGTDSELNSPAISPRQD